MDKATRLAILSKFDKASTSTELLTLADQVVDQLSQNSGSDGSSGSEVETQV